MGEEEEHDAAHAPLGHAHVVAAKVRLHRERPVLVGALLRRHRVQLRARAKASLRLGLGFG